MVCTGQPTLVTRGREANSVARPLLRDGPSTTTTIFELISRGPIFHFWGTPGWRTKCPFLQWNTEKPQRCFIWCAIKCHFLGWKIMVVVWGRPWITCKIKSKHFLFCDASHALFNLSSTKIASQNRSDPVAASGLATTPCRDSTLFRFAGRKRNRWPLGIYGVSLKIAGNSKRQWPQVAAAVRFRGRSDHGTLSS